ncbi:MAG: ATP-binding protein [Chloroflexi bacterium]|nr:ATP-binding protein [Chloroflexota bacterium]
MPVEGILYANEAFGTLVGAQWEQILGHQPMEWVNFDDHPEVVRYCDLVEAGDSPSHLVVRLLREDGAPVTAIFAAARVTFDGREAMCAQFIDISEEVRLREVAARARETDLALAVAGGVAHDFNNILTGVLGYLDFAAAELSEDSPEGRYVAAARLAARRAANLAQALLGFSRGSAAMEDPDRPPVIDPTHVVDAKDVVRETFAITRAAIDRRVAMITHEGEEPAHAAIPADSLLRVLVNLLVNSRDAVLERAEVAGSAYRPQIDLTVLARPMLGTLEISVTDNGTGIPTDVAARIFEPYFTTKSARGGSGIGLRAARDLARAAGGELSFSSEPGIGTTFHLVLPLVAAPAEIEF